MEVDCYEVWREGQIRFIGIERVLEVEKGLKYSNWQLEDKFSV